MPKAKRGTLAVSLATEPLPDGHIQITVSGPPEHVRAALTSMQFLTPITPQLCLQIAEAQAGPAGAEPGDTLGGLHLLSPESRTAYAGRCVSALVRQTGVNLSPDKLPQEAETTVLQVAEAMYDAAP